MDLGADEIVAWERDRDARREALARNRAIREASLAQKAVRRIVRYVTGARARDRASRQRDQLAFEHVVRQLERLRQQRDYSAAEELLLAERARQPGRLDLIILHAELAMSARKWRLASERWQRLMEVFGDGAPEEVQARLALALRSDGHIDEAVRVIQRAGSPRTESGRIALSFETGANLMACGELAAAAEQWRRLLNDPLLPATVLPVVREALTSVQRASGVTPDLDLRPERILAQDHATPIASKEEATSIGHGRPARSPSPLDLTIIVLAEDARSESVQARDDVLAWADPSIEVRVVPLHASAAALDAVRREADGELLMIVEERSVIDRTALEAAREVFRVEPKVSFVSADEDSIDSEGAHSSPLLRGCFDPDLLLGQPALGHAVMFRDAAIDDAGGLLDPPARPRQTAHALLFLIWDLALRMTLRGGGVHASQVSVGHHIAEKLIHHPAVSQLDWVSGPSWTGEGPAAAALVGERLRQAGDALSVVPAEWGVPLRVRAPSPHRQMRVSVIIPTRDRAELLAACVHGVLERTVLGREGESAAIDLEIVIVDNDSVEPDALALLAELERRPNIRVVPGPGVFNFSRLINSGAAHSSGEVLVLLNNDVVVHQDDWLVELVTQALRPEIGAVGALLQHTDGRVQHAGVLVGVNESAEHAFREWPSDAAGYLALLRSVRRVSAVTGACLAVRREVFDSVGGLDELHLPVELNDVDLCLRIGEIGLSVVWTPFARLAHKEGGTRGRGDRGASAADAEALRRQEAQRSAFVERWGKRLGSDPHYSPWLSTSGATYLLKR